MNAVNYDYQYDISPLAGFSGTNAHRDESGMYEAKTISVPFTLALVVDRHLEQKFQEYADKWSRDTQYASVPQQIMEHPSYEAILELGKKRKREIVMLMLRDLKKTRRPWFAALNYLTYYNPITPKNAGKTDKMIEAWVKWGEEKDLL